MFAIFPDEVNQSEKATAVPGVGNSTRSIEPFARAHLVKVALRVIERRAGYSGSQKTGAARMTGSRLPWARSKTRRTGKIGDLGGPSQPRIRAITRSYSSWLL